jgi:hypothetical protein
MGQETFTVYLGIAALVGIILGMILIAYEDGVQFARWKKLRCKLGWHSIHTKIGRLKVHKYYCNFCRKPRKHPELKVVDGGNKLGNNQYKF